jgi:hypothetical protein
MYITICNIHKITQNVVVVVVVFVVVLRNLHRIYVELQTQ